MAIYGLTKILIPEQRRDEVEELFQRNGWRLRPLWDATEGDVLVACVTGRQVVDKPLHWH